MRLGTNQSHVIQREVRYLVAGVSAVRDDVTGATIQRQRHPRVDAKDQHRSILANSLSLLGRTQHFHLLASRSRRSFTFHLTNTKNTANHEPIGSVGCFQGTRRPSVDDLLQHPQIKRQLQEEHAGTQLRMHENDSLGKSKNNASSGGSDEGLVICLGVQFWG